MKHNDEEGTAIVYQVPHAVRCTPIDSAMIVAPIVKISPSGVFIESDQLAYPDRVKINFVTQEEPDISFDGEVVAAIRGKGARVECAPGTPESTLAILGAWSEGKPAMVFTLATPDEVEAVAAPEEEVSPPPRRSLKRKRSDSIHVLVIDDDPGVLKLMKRILTAMGCSVSATNDPPTGLEILFKERVDAVLLDWMLPTIPGKDMLTELRTTYGDMPVAIISGGLWWDDADTDLRKAGATTILRKPIDLEALAAWIENVTPREQQNIEGPILINIAAREHKRA